MFDPTTWKGPHAFEPRQERGRWVVIERLGDLEARVYTASSEEDAQRECVERSTSVFTPNGQLLEE